MVEAYLAVYEAVARDGVVTRRDSGS
jgi:hypothetical protein